MTVRDRSFYKAKWDEFTERNQHKQPEYSRKYYLNNKKKYRIANAKYRASKIQRTPVWADHLVISMIYEDCPEGYQVDHIIPLQGKNVSGLHVPWNLQYLTPEENLSKGNRFVVT